MSPEAGGPDGCRRMRIDSRRPGASRKLKAFMLRKNGHTYCFCYPDKHERSAIRAAAECGSLDQVDLVALACYLGHDPKELGLIDKP